MALTILKSPSGLPYFGSLDKNTYSRARFHLVAFHEKDLAFEKFSSLISHSVVNSEFLCGYVIR